ncbi:HD domain-containing protein [Candidatus Pacearchaeota archaeon]|nr:HD domain-containing protein [Candidatus Pacearchaeota archaeon]
MAAAIDHKYKNALSGIIYALSLTIDYKDPYTSGHQQRVSSLACAIGAKMKLCPDKIIGIRISGQLHDIGKIGVPSAILSKPGRISDAEFQVIKDHAQIGYNILQPIRFPWAIAQITYQHHERLDGSGYPNELTEDEILPEAKILGVADVVEAMMSARSYRASLGTDAALGEIEKNRGVLYDPEVVDACLSVFREGEEIIFEQ